MSCDKNLLAITAFKPFDLYEDNVSEMVLKKLEARNLEKYVGTSVCYKILDVVYLDVKNFLLDHWEFQNPKLVVHMGMSDIAVNINIETQSFNCGYNRLDNKACIPGDGICIPGAPEIIKSTMDFDAIKNRLNKQTDLQIGFELSQDPGRDPSRVVFIHIPTLNKVNTNPEIALEQITDSLQALILALYEQIVENDSKKSIKSQ